MSIIKWEPFGGLDRFFEEFPPINLKNLSFDLAVDVYEENNMIIAKMNLPGVDPNKINIKIENSSLYIHGSHEEDKEKKDKHYYSREIKHGSFERVISLPHPITKDNVTAEYENGVLKVIMPREKESVYSKKIEIKVKK